MPTARKLPSGNYRVQLFVGTSNGKRIYKSITAPTKKEAEFLATQIKLRNRTPAGELILKEAAKKYIEIKESVLSPSTVAGYKEIIRNRFKGIQDKKLSKITQMDIDIEVKNELKTVSVKTIKNAYGFFATVIKYFQPYASYYLQLPATIQEEKHIPTIEEFNIIADFLQKQNSKFEIPYLLMGTCGLRSSEVRALTKSDFNFENNTVLINKASVRGSDNLYHIKSTKTKTSVRVLAVPGIVIEKIKQTENIDFSLSSGSMYKALQRACNTCDISPFSPHALRHFYVSVLHQIGIPESYGMRRTGHASKSMYNDNYNHQFSAIEQAIDNQINDFFSDTLKKKDLES